MSATPSAKVRSSTSRARDAVVIGVGLAQKLGIGVGDNLTIESPQGTGHGDRHDPADPRLPRGGRVFQAGVNDFDSGVVFLPIAAAQLFFLMPDAVSQIQVMVQDPDRVYLVNREIRDALSTIPLRIADWQQNNNSFFAAVEVERNVMFLILTLIIVVAAFNVISSLIMMVKEKTRDIAVLRTIGAGRGAVMRIFLMCGASVGILGTVVGTLLGVLFCLNIERIRDVVQAITGTNVFNPEVYYLTHLPADLQWPEVLQVVGMALVLSLLATLYPSWRAARTDPVEALRHE